MIVSAEVVAGLRIHITCEVRSDLAVDITREVVLDLGGTVLVDTVPVPVPVVFRDQLATIRSLGSLGPLRREPVFTTEAVIVLGTVAVRVTQVALMLTMDPILSLLLGLFRSSCPTTVLHVLEVLIASTGHGVTTPGVTTVRMGLH